MKSIVVFCGASAGHDSIYTAQARELGAVLATRNIEVIYGAAKIGVMGAVAEGALSAGGKVSGVIPTFLKKKEVAHEELTSLIVVDNMHQRKMKMHELSDGVIALPGGYGTLEELFEVLTWGQLGLHKKPIGILNTDGYYDGLIEMVRTMVERGFLKESYAKMLLVSKDIDDLLIQMDEYVAPELEKWLTEETT